MARRLRRDGQVQLTAAGLDEGGGDRGRAFGLIELRPRSRQRLRLLLLLLYQPVERAEALAVPEPRGDVAKLCEGLRQRLLRGFECGPRRRHAFPRRARGRHRRLDVLRVRKR